MSLTPQKIQHSRPRNNPDHSTASESPHNNQDAPRFSSREYAAKVREFSYKLNIHDSCKQQQHKYRKCVSDQSESRILWVWSSKVERLISLHALLYLQDYIVRTLMNFGNAVRSGTGLRKGLLMAIARGEGYWLGRQEDQDLNILAAKS
eukprot:2697431-Amphidinium_carterae.1